jgi:hypothetical protein
VIHRNVSLDTEAVELGELGHDLAGRQSRDGERQDGLVDLPTRGVGVYARSGALKVSARR